MRSLNFYHLISTVVFISHVHGEFNTTTKKPANLHARNSDLIRPMEPVLLPAGSFIALSALDPNDTDTHAAEVAHLVNEALAHEVLGGKEVRRKRSLRNDNIKTLAGIRPLSTVSVPMSIFIADQPSSASSASSSVITARKSPSRGAAKRKLAAGMKRIFTSLRTAYGAGKPGKRQVDFATMFKGLTPMEAVYVPKGILIPIARIPGIPGASHLLDPTKYFAGVAPLSIVHMPAGIFIPHRATDLPSLPPAIISQTPGAACDDEFSNKEGVQCSTTMTPSSTPAPAITSTMAAEEVEKLFKKWVETEYNTVAESVFAQESQAAWKFETNITDFTENALISTGTAIANFRTMVAKALPSFRASAIKDPYLARLYRKLGNSGDAILNQTKHDELEKLKADMKRSYSTAQICSDPCVPVDSLDNCPDDESYWSLSPQINTAMGNSRNHTVLLHLWTSWRDAAAKPNKDRFNRYVQLKNEAARLDGYPSAGLLWREPYIEHEFKYSDVQFLKDVKELLNQTFPLYQQLHAYVRRKLIKKYPDANISSTGPIPAHLLGNINSNNWRDLYGFLQPYSREGQLDVTAEMKKQGWTVDKMFKTADQFFVDLGLDPMPASFWQDSLFVQPSNRDVMCEPSVFDFHNHIDFRIKMCTEITLDDYIALYHQMGKLEYSIAYKNQLMPFREGANSGFLEAVGDTMILSVTTPKHLRKIKLLDDAQTVSSSDPLSDLNFLFGLALDKIAFLPFAYIVDKYRYDIFEGRIKDDQLNSKWWDNVVKYQGICSPVSRTEDDFDPGTLYQMGADIPYIRNFVSTILQFQFHKALCLASGNTGPLYECDIDGSKAAGTKLKEMMVLGSSVPWHNALEKLTGSKEMSAGPLLEYFRPLIEWLQHDNSQNDVPIGWDQTPICESPTPKTCSAKSRRPRS